MADNKVESEGMFIAGTIITKNRYTAQQQGKEDRFSFDIAIPGIKELLVVKVDGPTFGKFEQKQVFHAPVSFQIYKGRAYFTAKLA